MSVKQNVGTFLNPRLVYKEKWIRAIESLLLHADTDAALPAFDEFWRNYQEDVYEFFKRVALKATEHTQLSKTAKDFSASFGGLAFELNELNERNHQLRAE